MELREGMVLVGGRTGRERVIWRVLGEMVDFADGSCYTVEAIQEALENGELRLKDPEPKSLEWPGS
jgi:hypothetical protein